MRAYLGLFFSTALVACAASAPPPPSAELGPTPPLAVRKPVTLDADAIVVDGSAVWHAGENLGAVPEGRFRRLDGLWLELERVPTMRRLVVADDATTAGLGSALMTLVFRNATPVVIEMKGFRGDLALLGPRWAVEHADGSDHVVETDLNIALSGATEGAAVASELPCASAPRLASPRLAALGETLVEACKAASTAKPCFTAMRLKLHPTDDLAKLAQVLHAAAQAVAPGALPISLTTLDSASEDKPLASSCGTPLCHGPLSQKGIQTTVRASFPRIRQCYDAGLARNPKLHGRVTTQFEIGPDGRVAAAKDVAGPLRPGPPIELLDDADVRECIVAVFRTMVFAAGAERLVTVVYPINFDPSEGDAPVKAASPPKKR